VISGQLLNQFSMDEYQDHLRVGTTVDGNMVGAQVSANDVLILDKDLKTTGTLSNLGQGERIYSVRFINDKGYLVTFKQTDPFYVLDLSNASAPQVKGQLKIPGFSSYLDALDTNRILGVGQEDGKVKLSLFDVTDPNNPTELDHYNMNEYWTEVSNNHHAFLKDPDNKIFFIPGGQGGYIFSYDGDKFNLKKAVSDFQIKRAVYINNFLYVIGDQKIVVLNEKDWSTFGQLQF
jgi:inhibitor of cysteine peptidase